MHHVKIILLLNRHVAVVLFSSNDSRKAEHNFVSGGRVCDGPLKMVSQGRSDGTMAACIFFLGSNCGNSPYIDVYPDIPGKQYCII